MNHESAVEAFKVARRTTIALFIAGGIAKTLLIKNQNTRTNPTNNGAKYTELDYSALQGSSSEHPWMQASLTIGAKAHDELVLHDFNNIIDLSISYLQDAANAKT